MNILQALLSLDAGAIASMEREDGKAPSDVQSGSHEGHLWQKLLEALRVEAGFAATFIATSASIANALDGSLRNKPSAQALLTYLPSEMPILATAMPRMINGELLPELAQSAQALEARLSLARRMSIAYAAETKGGQTSTTVNLTALQDALAHTCTSAMRFLEALDDQTHPSCERSARKLPLLDLLASAANGQSPCVEQDGCVSVPGWAERRRHHRQDIDIEVEVELITSQATFTARAFDVSRSGFGLMQMSSVALASLKRGDLVRLKLPDCRILDGRIAWTTESKSGIELSLNLHPDDPILKTSTGEKSAIHR